MTPILFMFLIKHINSVKMKIYARKKIMISDFNEKSLSIHR